MQRFTRRAFIGALVFLTACGKTVVGGATGSVAHPEPTATPLPPRVLFGAGVFIGPTNFSIPADTAIVFDDRVGADPAHSGGTHMLFTGINGQFTPQPGAPPVFNTAQGTIFRPGQQREVIFPTPGRYSITCAVHPAEYLTIVVR
jgi:hypothetical protein